VTLNFADITHRLFMQKWQQTVMASCRLQNVEDICLPVDYVEPATNAPFHVENDALQMMNNDERLAVSLYHSVVMLISFSLTLTSCGPMKDAELANSVLWPYVVKGS